ncbi:hypothetical protein IE81DRAFT_323452 [Ceraceosorus guamensis]|uniref:Uncharacterized protein n=1 Tax=Ceraceosorus guamensis TaxID=1522189 RepID=A0A316W1Q3_9BASI|nr:hypothetical protein IE81DRAFT_323452 [Ceraceosorus guamensis]PWN42481.1 hypothetical protein IE81DRAFT_323452 [Ceraceosorus guamensis]
MSSSSPERSAKRQKANVASDSSHTSSETDQAAVGPSISALQTMLHEHQEDFRGRMLKKLHDLGFPSPKIFLVPAILEGQPINRRYGIPRNQRPNVALHAAVAEEHEYFHDMLHSGFSETEALRANQTMYVELDTDFSGVEALGQYFFTKDTQALVSQAASRRALPLLYNVARQILDNGLAQAALSAYARVVDEEGDTLQKLADPSIVRHGELAYVTARATFMDRRSRTSGGELAKIVGRLEREQDAMLVASEVSTALEKGCSSLENGTLGQSEAIRALLTASIWFIVKTLPPPEDLCSVVKGHPHRWNYYSGAQTCRFCKVSQIAPSTLLRNEAVDQVLKDILKPLDELLPKFG